MACTAALIPTILGGASQVLDMGRTRRLYGRTSGKALALRYPTCATDGCDIPAAWCEAHHAGNPWAKGGPTDLEDGMLLCAHHHHRAMTTTTKPDADPTAASASTDGRGPTGPLTAALRGCVATSPDGPSSPGYRP
jgi:hypothetical protein